MVVNKRKKNTRLRGSQTHGWGAKKKHRGAGNRGGRGRAGSGKRADQKKPCYQKVGKGYLGKHGFTSKSMIRIVAINIKDLESHIDAYVAQKLASKQGDLYTINLGDIGYNKLLGSGKATLKMNITVDFASAGAVEKVEEASGKVDVKKGGSDDEFEDSKEE